MTINIKINIKAEIKLIMIKNYETHSPNPDPYTKMTVHIAKVILIYWAIASYV